MLIILEVLDLQLGLHGVVHLSIAGIPVLFKIARARPPRGPLRIAYETNLRCLLSTGVGHQN